MSIEEIIEKNGMSARPGHYAGRGATTSDLDSRILEKIAVAIGHEYGDKALENFVTMVWQMKVLSATAFLTNLLNLSRVDWDLKRLVLSEDGKQIESHGEAFGMLMSVLGGMSDRDDTRMIRSGFRRPKNLKLVAEPESRFNDCRYYREERSKRRR